MFDSRLGVIFRLIWSAPEKSFYEAGFLETTKNTSFDIRVEIQHACGPEEELAGISTPGKKSLLEELEFDGGGSLEY